MYFRVIKHKQLELNHLSFAFFVTSQFKMLGTLDGNLIAPFALGTLQTQHQLFGCFSLENEAPLSKAEQQNNRNFELTFFLRMGLD